MKRPVWSVLQFLIGFLLVAALLWRMHHGRSVVEGVLDEGGWASVGGIYSAHADHGVKVTVQGFSPETRRVTLSCGVPAERAATLCGSICYLRSQNEHVITVRQITARPSGLSVLAVALSTGIGRWPWLIVSLLAVVSTAVICGWRWLILLRAQGVDIGVRRAGELYLVGAFFSLLLPGATAGDLVKGWYVTREAAGRRAEAATTVLLDRLMGFAGLVILAVFVLAWQWPKFGSQPGFLAAVAGVAMAAAVVTGLVPLALSRRAFPDGRVWAILARVREASRVALADRRVMFRAVALSLGNHAALIASECAAAMAVGVSLRPGEAIAGFMLVNVVASIPITPGGLGSREVACFVILGWFGVAGESAIAVSLLVYMWLVLVGIAGAALWMTERTRLREVEP